MTGSWDESVGLAGRTGCRDGVHGWARGTGERNRPVKPGGGGGNQLVGPTCRCEDGRVGQGFMTDLWHAGLASATSSRDRQDGMLRRGTGRVGETSEQD